MRWNAAAWGRSWPLASMQLALFFGVCALLWPTTQTLLSLWADTQITTYTHGYLIALISIGLLVRPRPHLEAAGDSASVVGYLLLAALSIVWLIAVRAGMQSAHQLLLPPLIWLAIYAALGIPAARRCAFAVFFLYFAIPLWGEANDWLQAATVHAVETLLKVTGVVAFVDGNTVHLARGVFEIAGGCSGLHFFIIALALAALYGEINDDSVLTRLELLALATVLALLTNWLRVYLIILAGYLTDMQHYLVRVEHYRFGWLVFAVMTVIFFLIARRLPVQTAGNANLAPPSAARSSTRILPRTAFALVAVACGPLWGTLVPLHAASTSGGSTVLPADPGQWSGPRAVRAPMWTPVFAGADRQLFGEYAYGQMRVEVYAATYEYQTQGKELVRYDNSIAGSDAIIVSEARVDAAAPVTEVMVAEGGHRRSLIWYFYQIGSRRMNGGVQAQLAYGVDSLSGNLASAVVAFRAACASDCNAERAALSDFVKVFQRLQFEPGVSNEDDRQ